MAHLIFLFLILTTTPSTHAEFLVHMDQCGGVGGNVFAANQNVYGLMFFDNDPSDLLGNPRGRVCGKLSGVAIQMIDFSAQARASQLGRRLISETPNPNNCEKIISFRNGERKVRPSTEFVMAIPPLRQGPDRPICCANSRVSGLGGPPGRALENPTDDQVIDLFVEKNPDYRNFPRQCFDLSRLSRTPSTLASPVIRPAPNNDNGNSI